MESRNEKFVRLAESRTNKVIKMLESISNLSNTKSYNYTDDQVKQIFRAIDKQLSKTKASFNRQRGKSTFKIK
jgi:mitochondrial fission protein ELM1